MKNKKFKVFCQHRKAAIEITIHMRGANNQAVVRRDGLLEEIYESKSLKMVRKIVTGYYPSAARHLGPARSAISKVPA